MRSHQAFFMPRQTFFFIISRKARGYPTLISPRAIFCLHEPPSYLPKPPLSPQAPLLSPRAKRGVPRLLRTSGRQGGRLSPRAPFLCHPEVSAEGSPWGRRPERSEGCLAIARRVGDEMLRFAQHDRMERHDRMEDVAPSPTLCVAQSPLLSPRSDSEGSLLESPVSL